MQKRAGMLDPRVVLGFALQVAQEAEGKLVLRFPIAGANAPFRAAALAAVGGVPPLASQPAPWLTVSELAVVEVAGLNDQQRSSCLVERTLAIWAVPGGACNGLKAA